MRPPIINHQDYWNTRQTIERLEDAQSRNILEEETISRDGHIIAGAREYLYDLRKSVKEYEKKRPVKRLKLDWDEIIYGITWVAIIVTCIYFVSIKN